VISETLKSALYRPMIEAELSLKLLMTHFAGLSEHGSGEEKS
jgi:hypothetical protein